MAGELENTLRNVAEKVAGYVANAATLTVETRYTTLAPGGGAGGDQTHLLARTVLRLDGDSEIVVPMREEDGGRPEIDAGVLDLHRANVATDVEYRARILDALLRALPVRPRTGP
jgi:hypothetical protein